MSKAIIPMPITTEEMFLIYKAVEAMTRTIESHKQNFKDKGAIEVANDYIALKEKLKDILELADVTLNTVEPPTYSEREED